MNTYTITKIYLYSDSDSNSELDEEILFEKYIKRDEENDRKIEFKIIAPNDLFPLPPSEEDRIEIREYERVHFQGFKIDLRLSFSDFYSYLKREPKPNDREIEIERVLRDYDASLTSREKSILYTKLADSQTHEMKAVQLLQKAIQTCPDNMVALFRLLQKYRLRGHHEEVARLAEIHLFARFGRPTLLGDSPAYDQFIEEVAKRDAIWMESIYTFTYYLEFEMIQSFIALGDFEVAYQLANRVLLRKMILGDPAVKQINHFRAACISHLQDRFIVYSPEKVAYLTRLKEERRKAEERIKIGEEEEGEERNNPTQKENYPVIFTVTTCKRFDLFEKTINSLLLCMKDLDQIGEWLCVDDNSSAEDRQKMQERYPFFHYIWKEPSQKGHARSMNIIRDYVLQSGYPYTLHMEDDWQSVCEMEFARPAIRIIRESPPDRRIKQVVQNRQYVQLIRPRDIDLKGGIQRYLGDHYRYIEHEFYPNGSKEQEEFWRRVGGGFSACYWPYYSLNPAIMETAVYQMLGPYREDVRHFEMDYANRFTFYGYKTAFLDGIFRIHIGKLIGEEGKKNAYELNELTQFAQNS